MTNEQLAEIETRLKAASKRWFEPGYKGPTIETTVQEDSSLIKNAPTDIAALIAEVRRLQDENTKLTAELMPWREFVEDG